MGNMRPNPFVKLADFIQQENVDIAYCRTVRHGSRNHHDGAKFSNAFHVASPPALKITSAALGVGTQSQPVRPGDWTITRLGLLRLDLISSCIPIHL
jgi:hypothetical protein